MNQDGAIERIRHGTYRTGGAPSDPAESLRAAWLGITPARLAYDRLTDSPPDGVVSHRSAAQLHHLGDIDADVHEFTITGSVRKQSRLHDVRYHHRAQLARDRWTLVDGLPTTTVLATIDDLAAGRLDGGHLAGVVRDAITGGHHLDPTAVADVLRPHAHRYGVALGDGAGLLNRFLDEAGVPESAETLGKLIAGRSGNRIGDDEMRQRIVDAVAAVARSPEVQKYVAEIARGVAELPEFRADVAEATQAALAELLGSSPVFLPPPDVLADTPPSTHVPEIRGTDDAGRDADDDSR